MADNLRPTPVSHGIARPTFTVLAGSGSALAGTLAVRVLMARTLSPADVGTLILTIAIATAFGACASLGLAAAAGRRIAELLSLGRRAAAGRSGRTSLVLSLAGGALAAVVLTTWAVSGGWVPGGSLARTLVPLFAPVCLGVAIGQAMVGVARGFGDATGRAVVRDGLGGLLRVFGVALGISLSGGVAAVAVGFAAGAVTSELAFAAYCGFRGWFRGERGGDRELVRGLPPYVATEVVTQANLWLDILVLGAVTPGAAVAYYGVARGVTRAVAMAYGAAAHSYLPSATFFLVAEQDALFRRLYRRARSLLLAITWPVVAATLFVPATVLVPLFGRDYLPGAGALRWLGVALLCDWLGSFKDAALLVRGDSRKVAAITTSASLVGLAALLSAVPVLGAVGAAIAVAVQAFARLLMLAVSAGRHGFLRLGDDLPPTVVAALAAGAGGGALALARGGSDLLTLLICAGGAAVGSLVLLVQLWSSADRGRRAVY